MNAADLLKFLSEKGSIVKRITALVMLFAIFSPVATKAEPSIGTGFNYWHAIDDIDLSEFDKDGASWFISFQSRGDYLLGWEADLEMMPKGFMASPKAVYAPQAYAVVGKTISGAVGVGWYYSDGEWADQPFYALRAGVELMLVPKISMEIMANYRFTDWGELEGEDINTDTIMLGAALRISL